MMLLERHANIFYGYKFRLQSNEDLLKPNFIYLSDINEKLKILISKYLNLQEEPCGSIDILESFQEPVYLNLMVEVNRLLYRNASLRMLSLMDKNMIYAPMNERRDKLCTKSDIVTYDKLFKLGVRKVRDVRFVLSLSLKLKNFTVSRDNHDTCIFFEFSSGTDYDFLTSCEGDVALQLHPYVQNLFLSRLEELTSVKPQQSLIKNTSEIFDIIREQTEFDSSMEELLILKSNDTECSMDSSDFSEEDRWISSNFKRDRRISDESRNLVSKFARTKKHLNPFLHPITEDKIDSFIENISNMRHNEDEVIKMQYIEEVTDNIDDKDSAFDTNDKLNPCDTFDVNLQEEMSIPPLHTLGSHPSLSSAFSSPRRHSSVSKKTSGASFSMINYEDEFPELKFAYNDNSSTVPTYIKRDKKFKFIKVGKVQKFVDLFEGKLEEKDTHLSH